MTRPRFTDRQREIMTLVKKGDGTNWWDMSQLHEQLGGTQTLQALQCSIRFLESHKMISREYATRRNRRRVVLVPTTLGFKHF